MTDTSNATLLTLARSRLVVHQAGQARTCLEALNDGQIWWRANEESNTVGNLVLHISGSTRWFIGHGIGNSGYVRDVAPSSPNRDRCKKRPCSPT